jgi:NAD(P)H dehydrogenase (quinone)
MKHALIVAHPKAESFNQSVARAYAGMVRELGHEVVVRDLYQMDFDPRLKAGEIPDPAGFAAAPDIVAEREILKDVEVFAFVYPLWFYAPPAMIVGYVDRVFSMGFGFGRIEGGGNAPLLRGRRMISFTSTGSPLEWVRQEGAWTAIRQIFDEHLAKVCGLTILEHVHFGGISPGLRPDAVAERLATVRQTVLKHF